MNTVIKQREISSICVKQWKLFKVVRDFTTLKNQS